MSYRQEITYEGLDNSRWIMCIDFDNNVEIICNGEMRTYTIPEPITNIEHDSDYVHLYVGDKFYQFKFEVNNFLVCDIFDIEGEHIEEFASHVFDD